MLRVGLPLGELFHHIGLGGHAGGRLDVRQGGIQRLHRAVAPDQAQSSLFPDALDAGDVVGGIPHQRLQVDHVDGGKAVLLPKGLRGHVPGGGLAHAGGHQLDLGVVGDELEGVLVPGHQHAVPPGRLALPGESAQQVVRLPSGQLVAGDVHGVQHLFEHRHLLGQLLRHGVAGGLVGLVGLVAEGGSVDVEGHAQRLRLLLLRQPQQRREKAVHRMGIEPVPCGQGTNAVIGPVDEAVAVQDHKLHGGTSLA